MKNKAYIVIILMALLISLAILTASAQEVNIVAGVKPGDEFTYNVIGTYPSNDPTLDIPREVIDAHATEYFKVMIDAVNNPEVAYTWSWHFNNGSAPIGNSSMVNIETTGNTGPFWAIVSANLTVDQRIHPHYGPDLSHFNETINYVHINYTRQTNRLQLQFAYQNNVTMATLIENTDTYFDKQTGMLVELNDVYNYQNPTYTTTIKWKLIETNAWDSSSPGSVPIEPLFTLPVIIALVVVVGVLGGLALTLWISNWRRKARQRKILRKR